jgi:hypothetical protein
MALSQKIRVITPNTDANNPTGLASDILSISAAGSALSGPGVPDPGTGVVGNLYYSQDAKIYKKTSAGWVVLYDPTTGIAPGGVEYTSGDGIIVFQDDPTPGFATVNMNQNINYAGSGVDTYFSNDGGATVVASRVNNGDGLLSVALDGGGAISINNNSLVESVTGGQGITISNPPVPFENQKTIENTGLLNVVDVGLPAYGSIASRSQPTGPADVEIKKFGQGSNISLTNDANGVLVSTSQDPSFNSVTLADRVTFGNPIDGVLVARIGANLQLYSGANLINMAGNQTIIDSTIRKQAPPLVVNLGTNAQPFNNLYVVNPPVITSDSRWKKDIQPFNMGLEFINRLQAKSYIMSDETEDGQTLHHKRRRCGLIAQDVHSAMISSGCDTNDCDILHNEKYDEDIPVEERLDKYMLSYSALVPVLINAVKELSARVAVLEAHHP